MSTKALTLAALMLPVIAAGALLRHRVIQPTRTVAAATPAATPGRRFSGRSSTSTRVAAAVAIALTVFVAGPLVVLGIGAVVVLVRRLRPIQHARRRRMQIERDLPTAMDLLVLSVRAGLTPQQAVDELASTLSGPVADAFAEVTRRTQRGQPFADALGAVGDLLGSRAGALGDVIATSDRHGLALGPTLDQLAFEAAAARHRLDQADARRLPVRLSFPLVACTLPSFVLLAIVPAMIAALSSLGDSAW